MLERSTTPELAVPTRFSEEQRAGLERLGFIVIELTGHSIASLKAAGVPFWSVWHEGKEVEEIKSRISEVAIHPGRLFLQDYSREVSTQIPGTQAIIGSVADYLELEYAYKEKTGKSLLRNAGADDRITTSTPFSSSVNLFVGELYDESLVASYRLGAGFSDIKTAPLIVPADITR